MLTNISQDFKYRKVYISIIIRERLFHFDNIYSGIGTPEHN